MSYDPQTRAEWQEAVNLAAAARAIQDCKLYGLLQGGPAVDAARCEELLQRGAQLGIHPSRPLYQLAVALVDSINADAATRPQHPTPRKPSRKRRGI